MREGRLVLQGSRGLCLLPACPRDSDAAALHVRRAVFSSCLAACTSWLWVSVHVCPNMQPPSRAFPCAQSKDYNWLRDAYLLSTRGKFHVQARLVRQPGRKQVQLSCYVALTKDSLSSSLVGGTFVWKDPEVGPASRGCLGGGGGANNSGEQRFCWNASKSVQRMP